MGSERQAIQLGYAGSDAPRPPGLWFWRMGVYPAQVAAAVGVLILLAYIVTRHEALMQIGLLWLAIGGLLTVVSMSIGVVYAILARRAKFAPPATQRRERRALLWPLLNVPLALGCAAVGLAAEHWPVRVGIINKGPAPISNLVIHCPQATYTIGSLAPGESTTRWMNLEREGAIQLSYTDGNTACAPRLDVYVVSNGNFATHYSSIEINGPSATCK